LLDFRIEPRGNGQCVVRQTALFQPRGLLGLVYWYTVLPFHQLVFPGMLAGIHRDALQIALSSASTTRPSDLAV
jgi:hypothetical protein